MGTGEPHIEVHDPEIRAAMQELGSDGWTEYTPYATGSDSRFAKLRKLCGIE